MKLLKKRPLTPTQRFALLRSSKTEQGELREVRSLIVKKKHSAGRNCHGRITSRRRGGGHRRHYRIVDFKRNKHDIPAVVQQIDYDPNRSADLALIAYRDGERRYILAPEGIKVGDKVFSSTSSVDFQPGNAFPLKLIPPSTKIHSVEIRPGEGARLARSAGALVELMGVDMNREQATVKMPSGEVRLLNYNCMATVGQVGNLMHQNIVLGKAGRNRWLNRRPRVRGVAMNPVDHPMGGGEGRTSGGGHPQSPWGQLSKGFRTRKRSKTTNALILVRRDGRKFK